MTSTPDRLRRWPAVIAGAALAAWLAVVIFGAVPGAADATLAESLLRDGRTALARGDGVAAEIALRKALAAGAARESVAARMGEAYLDQGDLRQARGWLGPARFSAGEAAHGWRMLGRLELAEGHPDLAGRAFDAALKRTPQDSQLWVDIARLRYLGGEQVQAIAAADRAVQLNPANPRALELRGLLVRDSFGLVAALPWLERGLLVAPNDLGLLGEYAATLGDLGRARQMVTVTRRMIALDPHNGRAFLLQAMLAARAGDPALARTLLGKAGPAAQASPAGLLVSGVAELESGNPHQAVDLFDRLVRRQPENARARHLLARALAAAGSDDELLARFGGVAAQSETSPYLLALVARALEDRGERERAAALLERAARGGQAGVTVRSGGSAAVAGLRGSLATAAYPQALSAVAQLRAAAPGAVDGMLAAGDLAFARGDMAGAVGAYRQAAAVRMTQPLLLRLVASQLGAGQPDLARQTVWVFRAGRPRDPVGLRLAAGLAAAQGQWSEADAALSYLTRWGWRSDARLQADLAYARVEREHGRSAAEAAEAAYDLQRFAVPATRAMAMAGGIAGAVRRDLEIKAVALAGPSGT